MHQNYYATHYSAEIVNTLTNLLFIYLGLKGIYNCARQGHERIFTLAFIGYLIVPFLILICELTLMNPGEYKTVPQLEEKIDKERDATRDVHDSDDELSDHEVHRRRDRRREHRNSQLAQLDKLLGDSEERQDRLRREEERQAASGVWGALHGKAAWQQMLSPWFVLMTLLTVLQMLRMNSFIATIRTQYEYMLHSEVLAKTVNTFFDVALPVSSQKFTA